MAFHGFKVVRNDFLHPQCHLGPPVEVGISVPFLLLSILVGEPSHKKGEKGHLAVGPSHCCSSIGSKLETCPPSH